MRINFWYSTRLVMVVLGMAGCINADGGDDAAARRYHLYDAGTLGGPNDTVFAPDRYLITIKIMNEAGAVVGGCDTAAMYPYSADGHASQACEWSDGRLRALEMAPGGLHSFADAINNGGLIVGNTATTSLAPNGHQIPKAAVWREGLVSVLQGLSGWSSEALAVNDGGLIAGYAVTDALNKLGSGHQYHPAIWRNGTVVDLGTFSGGLGEATHINNRGMVAGYSIYDTPTPLGVHVTHTFLWKDGKMTDICFGDYCVPAWMNTRGDVLMTAVLPGDAYYQAFIYHDGALVNLPGLGGNFSVAAYLTDEGVAVGAASVPGDALAKGVLWANGRATNLGTVSGDTGSWAFSVNAAGTVVGGSGDIPIAGAVSFHHGFVWQNGAIRDLNTLIPPGSGLTLNVAYAINDMGEITGYGTDQQGNQHIFVLRPLADGDQGEQRVGPDKPATHLKGPSLSPLRPEHDRD